MPDHELESDDFTTVTGHKNFKDTDPSSELLGADMNSVWRGLMLLVLNSGVGLAASAAAAATEGWDRIYRSIMRLARRELPGTFQMTSSTDTLVIQDDVHSYKITEASAYVNGILYVPETNSLAGRELLITNSTASRKILIGGSSFETIYYLAAGRSVHLTSRSESSQAVWSALAPLTTDDIQEGSTNLFGTGALSGQFDCEIVGSSDGLKVAGVCYWRRGEGFATLSFRDPGNGSFSFTLSGSQTIRITGDSDGGFPVPLETSFTGEMTFPVHVENNGVKSVGYGIFTGATTARKLSIFDGAGSSSFDGACVVNGFSMTYPLV